MLSSYRQILDADWGWIEGLPYRERVPAILAAIERFRTSPVVFAIGLHFAEVDDLARLKYPELPEANERRKRFLEEFLPGYVSRDRRRLSEYRIAGANAVKYAVELDEAGVCLFEDDILTKLIQLPSAIKRYGPIPEVFKSFASLSSRAFKDYAVGKAVSLHVAKSAFEEYLHEYKQSQSLLSL